MKEIIAVITNPILICLFIYIFIGIIFYIYELSNNSIQLDKKNVLDTDTFKEAKSDALLVAVLWFLMVIFSYIDIIERKRRLK